jgi:hypothetical protein
MLIVAMRMPGERLPGDQYHLPNELRVAICGTSVDQAPAEHLVLFGDPSTNCRLCLKLIRRDGYFYFESSPFAVHIRQSDLPVTLCGVCPTDDPLDSMWQFFPVAESPDGATCLWCLDVLTGRRSPGGAWPRLTTEDQLDVLHERLDAYPEERGEILDRMKDLRSEQRSRAAGRARWI